MWIDKLNVLVVQDGHVHRHDVVVRMVPRGIHGHIVNAPCEVVDCDIVFVCPIGNGSQKLALFSAIKFRTLKITGLDISASGGGHIDGKVISHHVIL